MKKIIILLIALVTIKSAMAQWFPQNSGTTNNLNSVYFTDELTGYVVGNDADGDGIILKTTNGGINWTIMAETDSQYFYSVYFTSADTGYLAGGLVDYEYNPGIIQKTTNGGESWETVFTYADTNANGTGLSSIMFPDKNTGYARGSSSCSTGSCGAYFLKTIDGGANWTVDNLSVKSINDVYFINSDTGFAVGQGYDLDWIILKTTNGGIDWTATNSGIPWNGGDLMSVYFSDTNTGYAVGNNIYDSALILKTTNGGTDWIEQSAGITNPLYSVYFVNADTGWAVVGWGNSVIIKTTNGGTDWDEQPSGTTNWLSSVYFVNADIGYVVGWNGTILKTTNGGLTGLNESDVVSQSLIISPNPANNKITISSPALTGIFNLSIFNVSGEKVLERQLTNQETQIDISALPRGVYFVRVQDEKMVEVAKMIKQ